MIDALPLARSPTLLPRPDLTLRPAEAPRPLDGAWVGTLLAALAVPLAVVLAMPLVGWILVAAMVLSPLLFGPILALAVRRDARPRLPFVPPPLILRRRPFRS